MTSPAHGSVVFQNLDDPINGALRYQPDTKFVGTDSFTYKIVKGTEESNVATVTINVTNAAPSAQANSFSVEEDGVLEAAVLANDSDSDEDPLTASLVGDVSHGVLSFYSDGSFVYTPDANFSGTDSFSYRVSDTPGANSSSVTVTLNVTDNGPIDLDARDAADNSDWLNERDEAEFGFSVAVRRQRPRAGPPLGT